MQDEGYLAKIFYEAGTKDIPLGKVLAILAEDKDDVAAFANMEVDSGSAPAKAQSAPEPQAPVQAQAQPAVTSAATPSAAPVAQSSGSRQFVSPLAKNMAAAHGVNLASVQGTGPNGRIIRADVEDALSAKPSDAKPSAAKAQPVQAPVITSAPGIGYTDI